MTQEIHVGEARVVRVEELLMPTSMRWLFPELADGRPIVEQNREWLAPHFVNDRGHLLQSIHSLVIFVDGRTIVVDTCVGNDKQRTDGSPEWHERSGPFLDDLARVIDPAEVDTVVCTHLHVDHVGWNTRLVDGVWQPTFPNARYVFVEKELAFWESEAARDESSRVLMDDSVRPVVEAGLADLVAADYVVSPSVQLEPSHGHTPGHVCVRLTSGGQDAVISGDLMHSPIQCAIPDERPRLDRDAAPARAARHTFLERYADSGVLVFGTHFSPPSAGWIRREGRAYRFETYQQEQREAYQSEQREETP